MFCRFCGKKNGDSALFCTECGAPLVPIHPDEAPGKKSVKGKEPKAPKVSSVRKKRLARVNWIAVAGLAVAIASVCTYSMEGPWSLYIACMGLLVNILALSFKRRFRWSGIAIPGLILSGFMLDLGLGIVVCIILIFTHGFWICGRSSRRSFRR
ncbi:MAG: zinc ribbon domain-containing protein [Clostridia bacterium]|nr:zinc ribbon domain-containing protein [Clostridia bacterium]